jgi:HEAT repeat protein
MITEASDRISTLERAIGRGDSEQAIVEALGDASTLVREKAIALAARHLSAETLGALLRDDDNAILRNAAFAALGRQGPYAVPHLLQLTLDPNPEVALCAVQILALINDSSAKRALLPLLDHPDRNIAQSAIEALGNVEAVEAVPALIRLLDADLWLQFAAVAALGKLGDARAVPRLLELVTGDVLAEPAIEALGRIGAADALGPLVKLLCESDRLPRRDHLLVAIAHILGRNTLSPAALGRLGARSGAAEQSGLLPYLRGLLAADDVDLARAAATLALSLQLWELLPEVLVRSADPEDARWLCALFVRFRRQAQPQLLQLCRSDDLRIRRGALACGAFDGRALTALIARVRDVEPDVRAAACKALGTLRRAQAIPVLLEALDSDSPPLQAAAAHALGQMPGSRLDVLAPHLGPRSDPRRMRAALEILEAARSTVLGRRIVALLADARAPIRRAALRVLGHHQGRGPEDRIIGMLEDAEAAVRTEAVEILVRRRCRRAEAPLMALLGREDALRYHVIRALGRLKVAAAAPRLMDLYDSAPPHERIEIVAALNQIAAPGLLAFLRQRIEDRDVETRRVASDGLARVATAAEADDLVALATDGDWTVRNHAAWGLGRLGLPALREPLLVLARDVEPVVARTARCALGKMGSEGTGVAG